MCALQTSTRTSSLDLNLTVAYTIWLWHSQFAMENHHAIKNGKPSIDGPFSMAMLNNQRIYTRMPEKKRREWEDPKELNGPFLQDLPGTRRMCKNHQSSQVFKIHADAGKMLYSNLYSWMDQGKFHGTPKQIFKKLSPIPVHIKCIKFHWLLNALINALS